MEFTKVIAYPIFPDKIRFQWEIQNQGIGGNFKFVISLAGSPEGPFEKISPDLYNTDTFLLSNKQLLFTEVRKTLYFKIECEPPKDNKKRSWTKFGKLFTLYHGLDIREFRIAKEITRKENLRFTKQIGIPAFVLKEKTFGEKCDSCIDECTGTIIDSSCLDCFATRFKGGYHTPVKVYAEIVELPVNKQIQEVVNTTEDKSANIRLTNEILVNKRDIIVDLINNNRWVVASEPNVTNYRSFPINQQISAIMVEPKDIIYKFPIEEIY